MEPPRQYDGARPARPVASTLAAALMLALRSVPPERWTIADMHGRLHAIRRLSRQRGTESSAIEPMKASAEPNAAPAAPMIMATPRIIASHPNQRGSVFARSAAADVASASIPKKMDA